MGLFPLDAPTVWGCRGSEGPIALPISYVLTLQLVPILHAPARSSEIKIVDDHMGCH